MSDGYLSGAELRNIYAEVSGNLEYDHCTDSMKSYWDALAAHIKAPRPPKPKTLEQTLVEWNNDNEPFSEAGVEHLRVLLNEARAKLDEAK